jgi:dipeptidase E
MKNSIKLIKIYILGEKLVNIILLSLNIGIIESYLKKAGTIIGFIPTAGEVYEDPYFVYDDRNRLIKLGYTIVDIDITQEDIEIVKNKINNVSALFVAGGNTFYLMQQLLIKGLKDTIYEFINSDHLFIGASAGGAICSPSLDPYTQLDDLNKAPLLNSNEGFSVVDFVVLPHYGKSKYIDRYHEIMKEYNAKYRMVPLRDDEALRVISKSEYAIYKSSPVLLTNQ